MVELVDLLAENGRVDPDTRDDLVLALLKREAVASTGVGSGVAIPHVKLPGLVGFIGAVGLSRQGIDFFAIDGRPVHVVFLFLSPARHEQGHLDLMARIGGICGDESYVQLLRQARSREEIREILNDAERLLLGEDGDELPPEEDSSDLAGV